MTTALFVCAATRLSYVLRSAPRQYVRPHRSVQIISFRRCASPVSHSSDSSHSPSFSLIRNNYSPLCYRWFWKVRAAYREKSSLLRKLESARISQDHASGRRAQQPAQQTAKDQRRARRGQRGEEAIQVCERLHGIPWAVAPRDQAVRADLQQVSLSSHLICAWSKNINNTTSWMNNEHLD